MKIGWIGLGTIGSPMAQQLIKAGYELTVYNRNKEKEETLKAAGAKSAATPLELINGTDVIILMVSDDNAVRDLCDGENGLLMSEEKGKILINMSTVSPLISKELDVKCKLKGNHYIDAPISGSVKQALEAQLVFMAGGEEEIFLRVKPVLESMGKMALLLGPAGSGNTAKLVINTLLGFYAQGLAEAMVLAENNGVDTDSLLTLINNGALANVFTKIKGDAILQDNYKAAFALKHIVKDVGLAKDIGLSTPMGMAMLDTFAAAEKEFGEEDIIAVVKRLRDKIN